MKRVRKDKLILFVLILVLSVGFAILSTGLNIIGSSSISRTVWKIYWDNVEVNPESVSGDLVEQEATITDDEKTIVEYSITLEKPGDFYEFTVNAKNDGTLDGIVDVVSNKVYSSDGETEIDKPAYLDYDITYGDGTKIKKDDILAVGKSQPYKVRVEFKKDVEPEDLPEEDQVLKFKFSVDYIQGNKGTPPTCQGLCYKGKRVFSNGLFNDLKTEVEGRCSNDVVEETIENDEIIEDLSYDITFEAISENSADVKVPIETDNGNLIELETSISIETDVETGDPRVIVGECTNYSNNVVNDSNFTYNGEEITDEETITEESDNIACPRFIELLASLDAECIKKLIGEPTEITDYVIAFNANEGQVSPKQKTVPEGESIGELPTPTKDGYYFDGWYTELDGGIKVTSEYIINSNTTIYAKWKKSVQSAIFESDNITITDPSEEKQVVITNANEIEEEYTFSSSDNSIFTIDDEGKITSQQEGTANAVVTGAISGQTMSVRIKIEYIKYRITFNANGGEVSPEFYDVVIGENIGNLPIPTLDDYHFLGWYTDIESGVQVNENYTPTEDMEIFARWKRLERCTLTFDKNSLDATGEMDNQLVIKNVSTTINKNKYSLEGYEFIGWNTERDGSGTSYLDKGEINCDSNTILYAQWLKLYKLTFDKNNDDAVGDSFITYVLPGETTKLLSSYYSKYQLEGKHIESYNSKSDNSGTSYYKGQTINVSGDTTLYAQWEDLPPITETIYWAIKDKTLTISDEEVTGSTYGSFSGDSHFTTKSSVPWNPYDWIENKGPAENAEKIIITGSVVPLSTAYWFSYVGYHATTFTADLSGLNTSRIIDMNHMFHYTGFDATTWSIGNLSNWDTSNVTNMSHMFELAGSQATTWSIGDLSNWDTSNVTDMSYMFDAAGVYSTSWSVGDLSNWDTSNVTDMSNMFAASGWQNATTWYIGDINNWDISNVTNMDSMFYAAAQTATIFDLDLSNWDTSNVTNMTSMFGGTGLNSKTFNLNLSNWDTSNVTKMNAMFRIYKDPNFSIHFAGESAVDFSIIIAPTNGNGINNDTTHMYGKDNSVYILPPSGRQFTLAS